MQIETFPPTAPNAMEYDLITEDIESHPRVITNPINSDRDAPPRVNTETLTVVNDGLTKFYATKDAAPPPRVRFAPIPTQIKSLPNSSCMACNAKPNIHKCPTLLKKNRAANALQLEQKQVNKHSPITIIF